MFIETWDLSNCICDILLKRENFHVLIIYVILLERENFYVPIVTHLFTPSLTHTSHTLPTAYIHLTHFIYTSHPLHT